MLVGDCWLAWNEFLGFVFISTVHPEYKPCTAKPRNRDFDKNEPESSFKYWCGLTAQIKGDTCRLRSARSLTDHALRRFDRLGGQGEHATHPRNLRSSKETLTSSTGFCHSGCSTNSTTALLIIKKKLVSQFAAPLGYKSATAGSLYFPQRLISTDWAPNAQCKLYNVQPFTWWRWWSDADWNGFGVEMNDGTDSQQVYIRVSLWVTGMWKLYHKLSPSMWFEKQLQSTAF